MLKISWDDSTNLDILKGGLSELFNSCDREKLVEHTYLFKTRTEDGYEFRARRIAGLSHGGEIADGAVIPTTDPVSGETLNFQQKRFGNGFTITEGMKRFEKYDLYGDMTRDLKKVQYEMRDIEVFKVFNNPTSTTYASGYDGLALLSNSHELKDEDSSTYDNYVTSDISQLALKNGYIYFDTIKDDQAQLAPATPDTLAVTPQDYFAAQEILGTSTTPYSADRTINVLAKKSLQLMNCHRLTDTDSWFLVAKNHKDYGPFVCIHQEPDIVVQDAKDTSRNIWVSSQQWFTYGFTDPRYVYGSVPA